MSWKENLKDLGAGDITILSEDGATITFVIVDAPILYETEYKGNPQKKVCWPVWYEDGFTLLLLGARATRRLMQYEKKSDTKAFTVTRKGIEGDTNAVYKVTVSDDDKLAAALFAAAKAEYKPEMLTEAKAAVEEMITR